MPMSQRKIVLLLVAFMIAIGTIVVSRSMMAPKTGAAPQAEEVQATPTQEILVAAQDLPAGTLIKEGDLKWQTWPKNDSDKSEFIIKGQKDEKEFVGTVVRSGLRTGEPVFAGRVVRAGEQGFMAAALSPGMRAVSIAITAVSGVAGFVFPGDRVDIIVTHQVGAQRSESEGPNRRVSETMLRNVRVLALDQKMNDQVSEPKVAQIATLEVTPKQAETMALAAEIGTVSLALRSVANDPAAQEAEKKEAEQQEAQKQQQNVPSIMIDAAALATGKPNAPPALDAVTWDSDVSHVLPRPGNRLGATQKIQIIRGKETTESVFELQQP